MNKEYLSDSDTPLHGEIADEITHLGFTGSRHGMTVPQHHAVARILASLKTVRTAHHGDCVGADAEFHNICMTQGISICLHPPNETKHRAFCEGAQMSVKPGDYLKRNREIVDVCDVLIAAPSRPEKRRSGTWSTVRYARKTGVAMFIVDRAGNIT